MPADHAQGKIFPGKNWSMKCLKDWV